MEKRYGMDVNKPDPLLEQMRMDMQQRVRTHYQSRMVAVTIPVSQAAFIGFLAGLLVGGGIWFFGGQPKYILAGLFFTWVIVTGIVWVLLTLNWNSLVWNVETAMGIDLTGDKIIGQPAAQKVIKAEVTYNGGRNASIRDLPEDAQLIRFLEAIYNGGDLSEARWTPAANGFSRSGYWNHISTLMKSGVLRWKNDDAHAQGVELAPEGKSILEQWLDDIYEYNGMPLPHREN